MGSGAHIIPLEKHLPLFIIRSDVLHAQPSPLWVGYILLAHRLCDLISTLPHDSCGMDIPKFLANRPTRNSNCGGWPGLSGLAVLRNYFLILFHETHRRLLHTTAVVCPHPSL